MKGPQLYSANYKLNIKLVLPINSVSMLAYHCIGKRSGWPRVSENVHEIKQEFKRIVKVKSECITNIDYEQYKLLLKPTNKRIKFCDYVLH